MIWRTLAYVLFSIPAAIGIWFIADYAFATSDDGWSAAFQLGLIAATAYTGPAIALAVGRNGHKVAAFLLGILAAGAMLANWSQTLDALANRGAGKEADQAKLSVTVKTDRARLERIERERAALPNVYGTDETVKAAQAAVTAAERIKERECGNGEPKQRGPNCRQRETEEQAKRDALATVLANKATTDKATKLDREIAEISARLAKAPAVKETSSGKTLGSLLSLSAVSAATFQQQFFSAVVELAIAASVALPELLRPKHMPATMGRAGAQGKREEEPEVSHEIMMSRRRGGVATVGVIPASRPPLLAEAPSAEAATGNPVGREQQKVAAQRTAGKPSTNVVTLKDHKGKAAAGRPSINGTVVVEFLRQCVLEAEGERVEWGDIFVAFRKWCAARGIDALNARDFGAALDHICDRANWQTATEGELVYCIDRKVSGI